MSNETDTTRDTERMYCSVGEACEFNELKCCWRFYFSVFDLVVIYQFIVRQSITESFEIVLKCRGPTAEIIGRKTSITN